MGFGKTLLLCVAAAAAVTSAAAAVPATRPATNSGLRGLLNPRHHSHGVGLSTPSGMEVEVSQRLLDYGATIINQLISVELSKTTIPEISGKSDGFDCAFVVSPSSLLCSPRCVACLCLHLLEEECSPPFAPFARPPSCDGCA
jgi:hypothetical protein